jgi:hypothetical protein
MNRLSLAVAALPVLLLTSCGDGPTAPSGPSQMMIVSGDDQIGSAGTALLFPLTVRVTSAAGQPVRNALVFWTTDIHGGAVQPEPAPSRTDADGIARAWRTLGPTAGLQRTSATLAGAGIEVLFTSVSQIQNATQIARNPDDDAGIRSDTVFATLSPYSVVVTDHNGNRVPNVVVSWTTGDGSLSGSTSLSDADGVAQVSYTLGKRAGIQILTASVEGLVGSPLHFEAVAEPGNATTVIVAGGVDQVGQVGQPVEPYTVQALDAHGNPVGGVAISWTVASGAGVLTDQENVTAERPGMIGAAATATHTLGPNDGLHTVVAAANEIHGAPQVTFTTRGVTARVSLVRAPDYCWWYYDYTSCDMLFSPEEVRVSAGSTVGWVWEVGAACDVVFEDDPHEPASSPTKIHGYHLRTFTQPGTYRYRCTHRSQSFTEGTVGTVIVE